MPRTIYSLLVAIDDYPSPIPMLWGCVNDIDAFATYLSERVAKDKGVSLKLKTLKNGEATRAAVVDAFRGHLGQATKGDVALFYYSGHGSQEQAPEEFWKLEPDHLDETLVCFDSRNPGSWDLADKEMAKLIGEVAAKGPHVAVILDCCHSGSGTREIDTVVRRAPTDTPPPADRVVHCFSGRSRGRIRQPECQGDRREPVRRAGRAACPVCGLPRR